jgi:hypothetical protein
LLVARKLFFGIPFPISNLFPMKQIVFNAIITK